MKQVVLNAEILAKTIMDRGFDIVSGGTKNHLMLVSLVKQGLTGKAADAALHKANITVNKNSVPNDPRPPMETSGIRVGASAMTTRGMDEEGAKQIAHQIASVLLSPTSENIATVRSQVENYMQSLTRVPYILGG